MTRLFSRPRLTLLLPLIAASLLLAGPACALDNLFFLHHSTGRNIIEQGHVRASLAQFAADHDLTLAFWDHDYNPIGLCNPAGEHVGWSYGIPGDNTDPDGLHNLWTTDNAARDSILANHEIIAFKSCYPASNIWSDQSLQTRQRWYREMRDVFDQHPDKIFVAMSQPPLHRLATDPDRAARARQFATWLGSDDYLAGHPNVVSFDLFDLLAHPDDGSPHANMLRYEYELSHHSGDSHPNQLANETVGPLLAYFLAQLAATTQSPTAVAPRPPANLAAHPNPFNPATTLAFELPDAATVILEIVDLRGHRVRVLADGPRPAGRHEVLWAGRDARGRPVTAGVYLARLVTPGATTVRPLTLVP
jgi:hypothetical protein